jgi:hypothetical protein
MPTVAHNRPQQRQAPRWTSAPFARAVLSLPATVARVAYGLVCKAVRTEGMVSIDGAAALCRARMRRDEP